MTTDYYYNNGYMPINYYNQLNGRSIQENYIAIKKDIRQRYQQSELPDNIKIQIEQEIEQIIAGLLQQLENEP